MYAELAIKVIPKVVSNFQEELTEMKRFVNDLSEAVRHEMHSEDYQILFNLLLSKESRVRFIQGRFRLLEAQLPEDWEQFQALRVWHEKLAAYLQGIRFLLEKLIEFRSAYYVLWRRHQTHA